MGQSYLQKWKSEARLATHKVCSICSALNSSKSEELKKFITGDLFLSKTFVLHMNNKELMEDAIGQSSLSAWGGED